MFPDAALDVHFVRPMAPRGRNILATVLARDRDHNKPCEALHGNAPGHRVSGKFLEYYYSVFSYLKIHGYYTNLL